MKIISADKKITGSGKNRSLFVSHPYAGITQIRYYGYALRFAKQTTPFEKLLI